MPAIDQRRAVREASFLLADVLVAGDPSACRVKVRNLSPLGMMGEGPIKVVPGTRLAIEFDKIGSVKGAVAWVQQGRFGVAFDEEIDTSGLIQSA
ncbi:MAG: PilZ domain-containing protein [Erythrobacter sp.]